MDDATGEADGTGLRGAFDRRLKLEVHGVTVTSDAGLLAFRELDNALGVTAIAGDLLTDSRTVREQKRPWRAAVQGVLHGFRQGGQRTLAETRPAGVGPALVKLRPFIWENVGWDTGRSAQSPDARRLFGYNVSHGGLGRFCEAAREGAHAGRSCAARHGDHRLRARAPRGGTAPPRGDQTRAAQEEVKASGGLA